MNGPFDRTLPLGAPLPGSSFVDLLRSMGAEPRWEGAPSGGHPLEIPEGTTVLALRYGGGVVIAGDRRATEGNLVAHREIQKVFPADHYSAVAIAGTAGIAIEMVRLFQVELEHYEKIESTRLSLEGKANFLARMVRNQLPMAFQGLVVVPIFAGYDDIAGSGRLFSYDVVGGRYEEQDYAATGSGSRLAKSYMRTAFQPDMSRDDAIGLAVTALVAAADEDTATGGPDLVRGIFPNVFAIDAEGIEETPEDTIRVAAERAIGGQYR